MHNKEEGSRGGGKVDRGGSVEVLVAFTDTGTFRSPVGGEGVGWVRGPRRRSGRTTDGPYFELRRGPPPPVFSPTLVREERVHRDKRD